VLIIHRAHNSKYLRLINKKGEEIMGGTKGRPRGAKGVKKEEIALSGLNTFNVGQAARYIGVSERTLRSSHLMGEIGYARVGRRILISKLCVDRWIERKAEETRLECAETKKGEN
jgi:excisionase family DNA binding protein